MIKCKNTIEIFSDIMRRPCSYSSQNLLPIHFANVTLFIDQPIFKVKRGVRLIQTDLLLKLWILRLIVKMI